MGIIKIMKIEDPECERSFIDIDTAVNIAGLKMKNPVTVASGTFGFGRDYGNFYDLSLLGGIMVKGLTLKPKEGNAPPRIAETPAGILNSVGLQNPGIEYFMMEEIPFLRKYDVAVIANIAGHSIEENVAMAELLGKEVDAIELNVSCPNVKEGGIAFGTKCESLFAITEAVKKAAKVPVIVKLSPNVTDITEMAKTAESAGADALSLINTLLGMAIDINRKQPILANMVGGLSGPAVKPVAVRMVWQVSKAVNIPVIGMGGLSTWEDGIEMMLAGADAISVGTANFSDPFAAVKMVSGIEEYMKTNRIKNIGEIKNLMKF